MKVLITCVPMAITGRRAGSMYYYDEDTYGIECLIQARQGKSYISFGAVLVRDNVIIGRGRNRHATSEERALLSHIDYAIHAEQAAIIDAIRKGYDVTNSEIYVLGVVRSGRNKGKFSIRSIRGFGCRKCPHTFTKYNISVNIPLVNGWCKLSPQEAMETAKSFCGDGKWRRFSKGLVSL